MTWPNSAGIKTVATVCESFEFNLAPTSARGSVFRRHVKTSKRVNLIKTCSPNPLFKVWRCVERHAKNVSVKSGNLVSDNVAAGRRPALRDRHTLALFCGCSFT